jgi:hypothetical protein
MLLPLPLRAEALPDLRDLAACTGRLSAVMEDAWHDGGAVADIARLRRDAIVDVLAAVTPAGADNQVMGWRVAAKAAHASLLAKARFGEGDAARQAARQAGLLVSGCSALVS